MIKASQKLGLALRKIVGTAKAKQYEAGLRNEDLSLTQAGKDFVLETLAEAKEVEEALTAEAQAIIDEKKKDCKSCD